MFATTPDIALGFLSATTVLYGFVIAYYAFARTLQEERAWRYADMRRGDVRRITRETYLGERRLIDFERVGLNLFLIIASVVMFESLLGTLEYVQTGKSAYFSLEVIWFILEVGVVVVFFVVNASLQIQGVIGRLRRPSEWGAVLLILLALILIAIIAFVGYLATRAVGG